MEYLYKELKKEYKKLFNQKLFSKLPINYTYLKSIERNEYLLIRIYYDNDNNISRYELIEDGIILDNILFSFFIRSFNHISKKTDIITLKETELIKYPILKLLRKYKINKILI